MTGDRWRRVPPAVTVGSGRHDQRALSRPPTRYRPPPQRVTTDRPRKTLVSLLQGYEGANQTDYPVEAASPRTGRATTPKTITDSEIHRVNPAASRRSTRSNPVRSVPDQARCVPQVGIGPTAYRLGGGRSIH
ncbi:hypothetical protein FAIPA1_30227 [Frankia sp. AiPs1]